MCDTTSYILIAKYDPSLQNYSSLYYSNNLHLNLAIYKLHPDYSKHSKVRQSASQGHCSHFLSQFLPLILLILLLIN